VTLNDLVQKANEMASQLPSGDVLLVDDVNCVIEDVTFQFIDDEGGQRVEMITW